MTTEIPPPPDYPGFTRRHPELAEVMRLEDRRERDKDTGPPPDMGPASLGNTVHKMWTALESMDGRLRELGDSQRALAERFDHHVGGGALVTWHNAMILAISGGLAFAIAQIPIAVAIAIRVLL